MEIVGESGPGSTYALLRPSDWNGGLVVWAHGYVQPFQPVQLPADDVENLGAVRDHALEAGYGFAYASYSHNGYAVKDGVQRTHELRGLFGEAFGSPERTYMVGTSMGGLIVELLSERYPSQYDGALGVCPLLDGPYNASYVAHFRVLFDWFFQDASGASPLPGSLYTMPSGYYLIPPSPALPSGSPAYQSVIGAIASSPEALQKAAAMAAVEQVDLQLSQASPEIFAQELVASFVYVLGYQVNGANVIDELTHGHGFFDNSEVDYSSPLLSDAQEDLLNHATFGVERFVADPPAVNYFRHWWEPTGDLAAPFLTLHTTRDPIVPFRTEELFRQKVETAGASDLLAQQSIDRFGHCTFGPGEVIEAFEDLTRWVEQGVEPSS
ncbi:MAG: hypothetical protein R3314_01050 [Longimicrobiales bacterium]|nr:hypothetical protein [Longimicrobiales bacterium]